MNFFINKKNWHRWLAFFMAITFMIGLSLPQTQVYAAGSDISQYIQFSDGKLYKNGTLITEPIADHAFQHGTYQFTINWEAKTPSQKFNEGDYFTFTVPDAFGVQSFDLKSPAGVVWATVEIAADGSGKITLNDKAAGQQNLKGNLVLTCTYKEIIGGEQVDWTFSFEKDYLYSGESIPYVAKNPEADISDSHTIKTGYKHSSIDNLYVWQISANRTEENWQDEVTITDTLGANQKMSQLDSGSHVGTNSTSGVSAYDFSIYLIDWNQIRTDYNDLYGITKQPWNYSSAALDNTDPTRIYEAISNKLSKDDYCTFLSAMLDWTVNAYIKEWRRVNNDSTGFPPGITAGSDDLMYRSKYPYDLTEATITSGEGGGFTIKFPAGTINNMGIRVSYGVELTTPLPIEKLENKLNISYSTNTAGEEVTGSINITGKGSIQGDAGELIIYKCGPVESELLDGVKFTLAKADGSYTKTSETDAGGVATFTLVSANSTDRYKGDYILTEDPSTTPAGYVCAEPINLKINEDGQIIEVNGVAIDAAGATLADICRVISGRQQMAVYNQKGTSITLTGTKNLIGKTLTAGMFEFQAEDTATGDIVATASNAANGSISLGPIFYTETGIYTYKVSEIVPSSPLPDIAYDRTVYQVTVTVATDSNAALTATVTYDDDIVYTNEYFPAASSSDAAVTLTGTKKLTGKDLTDNMFTFEVKDSSGALAATGTNLADGSITFSTITYDTPGTYTYTVSEKVGNQSGISYDPAVYTVRVEVADNGGATLTATPTYVDGAITFTNECVGGVRLTKYNAAKTTKLSGAVFNLYQEDGTLIGTYTTDSNGIIKVDDLSYGNYYFVEKIAPTGYKLDTTKRAFVIDASTTSGGTVYVELSVTNSKSSTGGGSTGGGSSSGGGTTAPKESTESSTTETTATVPETTTTTPLGPIYPPAGPGPGSTVVGDKIIEQSPDNPNVYYVFDSNGVPLGYIIVPDGMTIDEMNIDENLIPFAALNNSPKTGDRNEWLFILCFSCMLLAIPTTLYIRKKKVV